MEWHKTDISEVVLEFGTDINVGRTNKDPKVKRNAENMIFGYASVNSGNILRMIASDASMILLIVTYAISAILGNYIEALIAVPLIILSFFSAFYVRYSSEKQIAYHHNAFLPKAKIIENGKRLRVKATHVEVGDLIYFGKGDVIPADARLVSSNDLFVIEKFYNDVTGKTEFKRFEKNHSVLYSDVEIRESYDNMVYGTSVVVAGSGSAIVTSIGSNTRISSSPEIRSFLPEIEHPRFFKAFSKFSKSFSLLVLFSLIPLSLLLLTFGFGSDQNDLLYSFLTLLAIAATTMSEMFSAPAIAIITNSVLNISQIDSAIKFSAVDDIAEIDVLLILCPEALIDKTDCVRRIYYSDNEYRFDLLQSKELSEFAASVVYYLSNNANEINAADVTALRSYFSLKGASEKNKTDTNECSFSRVIDFNEVLKCEFFRTDGGSLWKFERSTKEKLIEHYRKYIELGLRTLLFISYTNNGIPSVFEGMIAIGHEYPFSHNNLFSNDIMTILFLETEDANNRTLALICGIINDPDDIVFASNVKLNGQTMADIPLESRIYIGFGKDEIKEIVQRISDSGRKILPIISNSADRIKISHLNTYATQSDTSLESIQNDSSMNLNIPDATSRSGGASDALSLISNSFWGRLKLNVFNKYLLFATTFRLALVLLYFIFGNAEKQITPLMLLLSALLSDWTALTVLIKANGRPKMEKNNFSSKYNTFYAIGGVITALLSFILTEVLYNADILSSQNVKTFIFYATIFSQLLAIASFLRYLKGNSVTFKFNFTFITITLITLAYIVSQAYFSNSVFDLFNSLGCYKIELLTLPWILLYGVISFFSVFFIEKSIIVAKRYFSPNK